MTGAAYAGLLAAAGLLALGGSSLVLLLAGLVLMDLAVQAGHVTSLGVVDKLVLPDVRSRATTVYMTTVFVGGASGSFGAAAAYGELGWTGTVLVAAALAAAALLLWLVRLPVQAPAVIDEAWPECTV